MTAVAEKVHGVENEIVNVRTENHLEIVFSVPAESDFFDGHFPDFKLLPAVAQLEIVTRFSKKYFDIERGVEKIRRMKFSSPILPGTSLLMSLDVDSEKNQVAFEISDATDKRVYSCGAFKAFPKDSAK
ncbi:MAG: hydroxymyristoyl-ACP dehydratase [Treponema sp.]|nr:hydroxymyristoyl-ACP dehydratase [Treponema sp.]